MHPVDYLKTDRWEASPWHVPLMGEWMPYHREGCWHEDVRFVEVWWCGPSTVQRTKVLFETMEQWGVNVYQN